MVWQTTLPGRSGGRAGPVPAGRRLVVAGLVGALAAGGCAGPAPTDDRPDTLMTIVDADSSGAIVLGPADFVASAGGRGDRW